MIYRDYLKLRSGDDLLLSPHFHIKCVSMRTVVFRYIIRKVLIRKIKDSATVIDLMFLSDKMLDHPDPIYNILILKTKL